MTRRRRTRAAVALADIMAEWEQEAGEKVARGWRRLQEVTWPGSWPRGLQRCRSVEILEAWTIAVIAPSYHVIIRYTCIPTRLPATPLMTGWNTAMSGYLPIYLAVMNGQQPAEVHLAMTVLRILPPMLEMTMAASTGLQPCTRMGRVWGLAPAREAHSGPRRV